jgi:hypothetical protein
MSPRLGNCHFPRSISFGPQKAGETSATDEAKIDEAKIDEAKIDEAKIDEAKIDEAKHARQVGVFIDRVFDHNVSTRQ